MSPPAHTPGFEVARSSVAEMYPRLVTASPGVVDWIGIRRGAGGNNRHMARHNELRALDGHRTAASRIVRLAQFLADALHGSKVTLLVAEELHRIHQHLEVNALVLGVMHLFHTGGHLFFGAAVVDAGTLCAQAQRTAHRIHRGVAAAPKK